MQCALKRKKAYAHASMCACIPAELSIVCWVVRMAGIRGFSLAKITKVRVAFAAFDSRVASAR